MIYKKIAILIVIMFLFSLPFNVYSTTYDSKSSQRMANVVVFAYFEDVDPERLEHFYQKDTADELLRLFDGDGVVNFKGYINEISHGKLQIENVFPQLKSDNTFSAIALPYTKEETKHQYVGEDIVEYIAKNLATTEKDIDLNDDGIMDSFNVVYIDDASSIDEYPTVWPHQYTVKDNSIKYSNQQVLKIHCENTDRLYSMPGDLGLIEGAGLISHEFLHVLGYPDLYAGYNNVSGYTPVGGVDIMAVANERLQWPLSYMRQYVSGWVNLPIITESQDTVTVHLQSNRAGTPGVIIKSPLNDYEFFVVEFRQDTDNFANPLQLDSGLYDSGLIIYRINTNVTGLSNFHGQTGVYVFRDPTLDNSFLLEDMFFSGDADTDPDQQQLGSTNMSHGLDDGAITFSDGTNSGVVINSISESSGDHMTFSVTVPIKEDFDLWEDTYFSGTLSGDQFTDIASYNNTLYALSAINSAGSGLNNFNLYEYKNAASWQKLAGFNDTELSLSQDLSLFEFEGNLHVAYTTLSGDFHHIHIKKYLYQSNSWVDVASVIDDNSSGAFDIVAENGEIYLAYIEGGYPNPSTLKVCRVKASDTTAVNIDGIDYGGQPKISVVGNKIYASIASGLTVNTKEVFGTAGAPVISYTTNKGFGVSYDIVGHENHLYLVVEQEGNIILNRLEDDIWVKQAEQSGEYHNPTIQTSQGNLYVLAGPNSDVGVTRTGVYRFNNNSNLSPEERLIREGENVDFRSSNQKIVSIDNALYVSYKRGIDDVAIIKEKISSNQLIAISINTLPTTTNLNKGEAVDLTGLTINANYEKEVKLVTTGFKVSGFDTTIQGERYATVTYEGKTTSFPYFVQNNVEVESPYILGRIKSYNNYTDITIKLYSSNDFNYSNLLYSSTVSPPEAGGLTTTQFAIGNLAFGSYNIVISKPAHIDYIIKNITIDTESINLTESNNPEIKRIDLLAGDVNADNIINFIDLSIIRNSKNFNNSTAKLDNNLTDINADGLVNIEDLNIIASSINYNKTVTDSTITYS